MSSTPRRVSPEPPLVQDDRLSRAGQPEPDVALYKGAPANDQDPPKAGVPPAHTAEPATPPGELGPRRRIGWTLAKFGILAAILGAAGYFAIPYVFKEQQPAAPPEPQARESRNIFHPTQAQWATLTVEPVRKQVFRAEHMTEGKIAVDEDQATPIYSPYAGRVTKLLAKPGDRVERGQALFVVEAADAVQIHNDFMAAIANLNKAKSQLNLARTVEKRLRDLYSAKAISLREWQQSQADVVNAENDVRSSESALEAARNRLRILGRTEAEIAAFESKGMITAETPIVSPISGIVVQRKVGPGQYITSGSTDPVFVIGDVSKVWLVANVRESEAPKVHTGQAVYFKVLAFPDQVFAANLSYVSTAVDPTTRRLTVRAVVNNPDGLLKPEMFASVTILTGEGDVSLAVPRDAVIYEGNLARVWVVRADNGVELRQVKLGLVSGRFIQVEEGLREDEKVITRGSLFIDREALGG